MSGLAYNGEVWRLRLRPLGWLGLLIAGVGTAIAQGAVRTGDWTIASLGVLVLLVGAAVMLRGGRKPFE